MNLSEAIREGAKITEPIKNSYLLVTDGGTVKACALGAAAVTLGLQRFQMIHGLNNAWPFLAERSPVPCPRCSPGDGKYTGIKLPFRMLITHLNDSHHWTREEIADWLEELGL